MSSTPGLPLDTFLQSLPWLSNSHCAPQSAQDATNSCNACTSVSANCCGVEADAHHGFISGVARFYISAHQQICFSPSVSNGAAVSDISAVIGVEQGKIRLVLRTDESAGNVCMTIDETHIVKPVQTSEQQNEHKIHFTLPFIILVFQNRAPVSADSSDAPAAKVGELKRFENLKEAVNKLRITGIKSTDDKERVDEQQSTSASEQLSEQKQSLEDKEGVALEHVFMNVISKGAHMVMPTCYPYVTGSEGDEDAGNSSALHKAFVEACMRQETAIRDSLKQAEGWVHFARRKRTSVEQSPTKNGARTQRTSELLRVDKGR
ncbi:hypothetical protein FGB62_81g06 [Gracilaria domingensis]|nr:hypothetical protein FGB62_81g06 [Gracilaria domingensis]